MHFSAKTIARSAIIAAIYTALTLLFLPISFKEIQMRVSELCTLLPIFFPEAIPGVTIGCLLSNILGGAMLPDIIFGTLATLLAAICTYRLRSNRLLASTMPVIFNGLIVGTVVHYCYSPNVPLPLCMLFVAIGEAVVCILMGQIFMRLVDHLPKSVMEN